MRKFISCLMCFAVLITTSVALRCFVCDSDQIDGCIKETRPKNYTCGSKMGYFRQVCAYTVLYDTEKDVHKVHTGCELINEKDPVAASQVRDCLDTPSNIEVKECRVCDHDLCNSASHNKLYLFTYLFITYLVTTYVLS